MRFGLTLLLLSPLLFYSCSSLQDADKKEEVSNGGVISYNFKMHLNINKENTAKSIGHSRYFWKNETIRRKQTITQFSSKQQESLDLIVTKDSVWLKKTTQEDSVFSKANLKEFQSYNRKAVDSIKKTKKRKTIAGFNAQKTNVFTEDGQYAVWLTNEIQAPKKGFLAFNFDQVDGFPLIIEQKINESVKILQEATYYQKNEPADSMFHFKTPLSYKQKPLDSLMEDL